MNITYRLDLQSKSCPYPTIATLEALPQLEGEEILKILCDCPQSINSIPHDSKARGFEVLSIEQDGPILRFLIQKP